MLLKLKRRDSRNRILRSGESQRRDGRYAYKYIDTTGKPQFVYSWKLEKTDKTPPGKRDDLSLREMEKIREKGIDYVLVGDYYIPDLKLPEEERRIGKYGCMHREYLKENNPMLYNDVILSCQPWTYLADVNEQAQRAGFHLSVKFDFITL